MSSNTASPPAPAPPSGAAQDTQGPGVIALVITLAGIVLCASFVVFVFRRYFCLRQRQLQEAREQEVKPKNEPVKEVPLIEGVIIQQPDGLLSAAWEPHIRDFAMTKHSMELKPQQACTSSDCNHQTDGSITIMLPSRETPYAARQIQGLCGPEQV